MSTITLNFANCLSDRVGEHGLSPQDLDNARPVLAELTRRLNDSRGTGWEGWRTLPFDPMRHEHLDKVKTLAEQLRPGCENLIVLGIGGSALGNTALQQALNPETWNLMPRDERNGPRLFVLDNVDPHFVGQALAEVQRTDPGFERTIVNVISKSGETAETAAQFIIVRSMLRHALGENYNRHIIATTDPVRGTMRAICDSEGYTTLPVPEGVGGRFSVLSPVALFSAAMCGIDVDQLLEGAADMDHRCQSESVDENPAAVLAWLLTELTQRGKPIHVLMPYCNALYGLADWYRQLWAESLGKKVDCDHREVFTGPTPVKALGATDQHSQIQLYREGPNDKVIGFMEVEQFDSDLTVPADLDVDALKYLQGSTLSDLLNAEKRATEFALVESKRPNFTIRMPSINAFHVGQFMQLWMVATAYAGQLLNINAYDQPAVETGKVATFGLMGRAGYDEWRQRVESLAPAPERTIPRRP